MTCSNCGSQAARIISYEDDSERCENCSEMSAASKNQTDGMITRNSWRVRRQQSRYEGDIIRPHKYDKNLRRETINPDFVKTYGAEKTKNFFSADEMKRDGYAKMPAVIAKQEKKEAKLKEKFVKDTVYSGSKKTAFNNFLEATGGVPA